jgi:hypothetical protein
MRSSLTSKRQKGFTLVEILIIAPVVIIVISGFVALMITIIGDVLTNRDTANMSYEIQDGLDRIEQDTRLTTQFLVTTGTQVAPQGSDSNFTGTAAFTSTNALIMGGLATDKNPADNTRKLIFYAKQPNDCNGQEIYNRVFQSKIIYFIKNGSLWRRTVLPDYNTNVTVNDSTVCVTPWQQNSCSPGYSLATRCQTNDIEVTKNVKTFTVKYLSAAGSTVDLGTAQALNANAIEVTVEGEKTTAGRTVNTSGSIRGTKLNSLDVNVPVPGTPIVSTQLNGTSATFNWAAVPMATSYELSYNINGGALTNVSVNAQTLSYTVNAGQGNTVTMRVAARNASGTSAQTVSTVAIPLWYTPSLLSNWQTFDSTPPGTGGYSTPAYTKTSADIVVLKGVIKDGSTALDAPIMRLPIGYRPTHRLIFQTDSGGQASRVDVMPNGDVLVNRVNSSWLVLDGIRFVASTASVTWTTYTSPFSNGWRNYDDTGYWAPLRSTLDSVGRTHVQGLVAGGVNSNPTTIFTLPVGQRAPQYTHIPAASTGFNYTAFSAPFQAKGVSDATNFYSLQAMFYPTTLGWSPLTLLSPANWQVFDLTGHSTNEYRKGSDGIVTVKGLIKNGDTTGGAVIAQLPPGYRPKERLCFAGVAGAVHSRIDILSDGKIIVAGYANSGWTSMDNISFIAEQ